MKQIIIVGITFGFIFLSGCATSSSSIQKRHSELISEGVYATNDSMSLGRFDLAWKYSQETTKLITPPKNRIPVSPLLSR